MNNILHLKGIFSDKPQAPRVVMPKLPKDGKVSAEKVGDLINDLEDVKNFWSAQTLIPDILISVKYRKIVAKSNRLTRIFAFEKQEPVDSVRGARFDTNKKKHIFTHYISRPNLNNTIATLRRVKEIIEQFYQGEINATQIDNIKNTVLNSTLSKSNFAWLVVDCYYVEKFYVHRDVEHIDDVALVTIYDVGKDSISCLRQIGIHVEPEAILDNTTLRLPPSDLEKLKNLAPYLISMGVSDLSLITSDNYKKLPDTSFSIPKPDKEPIIGVIDTMFDERVYFSEWVKFENRLSTSINLTPEDYVHGTSVTSILVDGSALNPKLDDGCGRFRVRHFGVAQARRISSFTVMREIEKVVKENPEIKVWNLSLGSSAPVNEHFISPESAFLDRLQHTYDVIFVVCATNKQGDTDTRVGAPADSINSIVVNSVDARGGQPAYARSGPVLTFFQKPDVSYYGGDETEGINVYSPIGLCSKMGTSYATPWITRKIAYLIHVMRLTREEAKAILIDAAAGWDSKRNEFGGFGIVPVHITDILQSKTDEIKFLINSVSKKETIYNYEIPVPIEHNKFPYMARATICYFSPCSRKFGVDYTNTELTPKLGRVDSQKNNIKSIDKNQQYEKGSHTTESKARNMFGKWENVKLIREIGDKRAKENLSDRGMWGLEVKALGRGGIDRGESVRFAIVVTLKELNGINRIKTFMQQCRASTWIVNEIDMKARVDIQNLANQEIEFDDFV